MWGSRTVFALFRRGSLAGRIPFDSNLLFLARNLDMMLGVVAAIGSP